jgi:type IV pilus assembly protein PilQ
VQTILLALWLASAPELNPVRSVDYAVLHPGEVLIRIELARPLTQPPSGFRTFHPAPSVVLELPGTAVASNQRAIQPERGLVSRIRLVGHPKGTRLVIELTASATYETAAEGSALLVTLRRTPRARTGDRWQRFGAAPPQYLVRDLRFERGPGGEGSVHASAAPMTGIDVRQEGRRLIVTFLDTAIDAPGERRLDVLDFATPIEAIEARSAGRDALLLIETGGAFEYSARQAGAEFTLTVTPRAH